MIFSADFETTTYLDETESTRVWSYGLCEVGNTDNFIWGTTLDSFMEFCSTKVNHVLYFHNLKFDGKFILAWLFRNSFAHVVERKDITSKTFTTLISDKGQFYSIEIYFKKSGHKTNKVTIYDSLKILPFSVDEVAKSFKLPIKKGKIDYKKERKPGYIPDDNEIDYLKNDVQIMAMALKQLFDEGMDKMTAGSNALSDYKAILTENKFNRVFPTPYYDREIRDSYKGGFTYCSPRVQGKILGKGIVLDVNSLYPSVMYYRPLPMGDGVHFTGKYEEDKLYPLYVQKFRCMFELKENHIPTLQIKGGEFVDTEYLTSSNGEYPELTMTNVDLELFFEHYIVTNEEYISGWKFRQHTGLFRDYIDKWMEVKVRATKEGNAGMRTLSKLMLNSLYGKFSLNPNVQSKYPYLDADTGIVKFKLGKEETRDPIYIPVGTFITAWARYTTITAAQKVYDRFCYADTDSLHLLGTDIPAELEIDDTKLGAWKHENTFDKAKFVRQKTYMEAWHKREKCRTVKGDGKLFYNGLKIKITCAGMTSRCYKYVTFDNFDKGSIYPEKLKPRDVKGGVILEDTFFTIRKG